MSKSEWEDGFAKRIDANPIPSRLMSFCRRWYEAGWNDARKNAVTAWTGCKVCGSTDHYDSAHENIISSPPLLSISDSSEGG